VICYDNPWSNSLQIQKISLHIIIKISFLLFLFYNQHIYKLSSILLAMFIFYLGPGLGLFNSIERENLSISRSFGQELIVASEFILLITS
ncbi:MAG: hypothetical protein K1060chlam2_01456, partial [Chlamydiae bacterium]|nr:hypothetical protein [Chlamydiota bacterium]